MDEDESALTTLQTILGRPIAPKLSVRRGAPCRGTRRASFRRQQCCKVVIHE